MAIKRVPFCLIVSLLLGVFLLLVGCSGGPDTTPPRFEGVRDLSCPVGSGLSLRTGVRALDERDGEISFSVDTQGLDTHTVGVYQITYAATDAAGNHAEQSAYVHVYAHEVTAAQLEAACSALLADLVPVGASRAETCRIIYDHIQSTLDYFPLTDKTDLVRAAYTALFEQGRGDCYAYFAAARALLDCAGIPYLPMERIHAEGEETHLWFLVNIAAPGEAARWYHFDPTEIDQRYMPHDGCLFTDAELAAYNAARPGFYAYDRAAYPPTDTRSLRGEN